MFFLQLYVTTAYYLCGMEIMQIFMQKLFKNYLTY